MTLLAVILALVVEQAHALPVERLVKRPVAAWCRALEEYFNDGKFEHGAIAWGVGVGLPALSLLLLDAWLSASHALPAFLVGLVTLYLTMGFRQFSHYFTEIQAALREGEIGSARSTLGEWRGEAAADRLTSADVARLAIEEALISSHRHVFAPLFWFAALGPAGALLYRLADRFRRCWAERPEPDGGRFGEFARRAFLVVDWLPVRLTAASFAIVGDFEDAVNCWRTQARQWTDGASGILLASGAGALGVRLGLPVADAFQGEGLEDRPELGLGEEADPDFMQSTVGLVWRTLLMVLLVIALVSVSGWIGA